MQWLRPMGAYLWRYLSGMPPEGVPRADAGWSAPRHRRLPPNIAPPPSGNPLTEILSISGRSAPSGAQCGCGGRWAGSSAKSSARCWPSMTRPTHSQP